jgi:hypothetical protein
MSAASFIIFAVMAVISLVVIACVVRSIWRDLRGMNGDESEVRKEIERGRNGK